MSSKILLEIINFARLSFNENPVRLNDFNSRIADELEDEHYETFVVQNTNNTKSIVYGLTIDQCMLIGMRESKAVRKNVLATLKQNKPLNYLNLSEALRLAADQAKKLKKINQKSSTTKIVVRDTPLNATQVAQKIGISAISLNKHLEELDVYNRSIKRCRAFQQWFVDQGLGLLKQTELGYSQPMFTLKGEAWVIEKLVSEGAIS